MAQPQPPMTDIEGLSNVKQKKLPITKKDFTQGIRKDLIDMIMIGEGVKVGIFPGVIEIIVERHRAEEGSLSQVASLINKFDGILSIYGDSKGGNLSINKETDTDEVTSYMMKFLNKDRIFVFKPILKGGAIAKKKIGKVGRPWKERDKNMKYELKCYFARGKKYCFPVYVDVKTGFEASDLGKTFAVVNKFDKGRLLFSLYRKNQEGKYSSDKVSKVKNKKK